MKRLAALLCLGLLAAAPLAAQSLDIPSKKWGLSIGNSKKFTGLRFNFRDRGVQRIDGVNFTLWWPRKDNEGSVITGLSLGIVPGGGRVRGIQLGLLGAGANKSLSGLTVAGLGAGAGENVSGITFAFGGVGAGENIKGIAIGGLGAGAGENATGLLIGGLGAGVGGNLKGIAIGGLGVGAGEDVTGFLVGGLGAGCGNRLTGVAIGGLGIGAGERIQGIVVGGIGAGAPEIRGLAIGGLGVGGERLRGVFLALGMVHVPKGGKLVGFGASSFNYCKGTVRGVTVGIVNYAWRVQTGFQLGIVNIIRDNPKGLRVLPVFNAGF
jgi:hypothetical protein